MKDSVLALVAIMVLLGSAFATDAKAWTFRPDLVRLDADDNPLREGPANVTREDTLRVGLSVVVSTDGGESIVGFDSLSGAIRFTSDDLAIADIEGVVSADGVEWERKLIDTNTTFGSVFSFVPGVNQSIWVFTWDHRVGQGSQSDPRGAWCAPVSGQCTIFVGVLTVPLSALPTVAAGVLSLKLADSQSPDDPIQVGPMHSRGGDEEVEPGNTIAYNICPASGCPMAPGMVDVAFAQGSYSVIEGGYFEVTVTLSEASSEDVTVPVQATVATASAVRLSADSVTFAAGETIQVITVTALQNDVDPPGVGADETTSVQLEFGTLPESVMSGAQADATISIADDDVPSVTVSFGAAMYSATEDGASATVRVNVTPAPERALTIPLTVQYEGGATAADVIDVSETVKFAADQMSTTFTVTTFDDTDAERGESLTLGFGTLPPGVSESVSEGVPASATVILIDDPEDEAMDEVLVHVGESPEAMEEGGMVTVRVLVNAAPAEDLAVAYALMPGTALAGDYRDEDGGEVTIASGEIQATITVAVVDDNLSEGDENFTLTLMSVTSADPDLQTAALGDPVEATLRILGSDPLMVSLAGDAMAREGTMAKYTVSLAGGVSTLDVEADVMRDASSIADESDLAGDTPLPVTVTVPAGQSSATFMLGFNDEDGSDENEVLVLRLGEVRGGGGAISVDMSRDTVETTITETNVAQRGQAMKHVLAAFGRTVASNMVGIVESRAAASRSPALNISQVTLAGKSLTSDQLDVSRLGEGDEESQQAGLVLAQTLQRLLGAKKDEHGGVTLHPVSGRQLLTGSSFQLPMAGGAGSSTVWGRGASAGFEGEGDNGFFMDGGVLSGHVGLDFHPFEDVLAGFAVGYNEGTSDYRFAGDTEGKIDTKLTTYAPYAHLSFQAGVGVWAMLGYGQGEGDPRRRRQRSRRDGRRDAHGGDGRAQGPGIADGFQLGAEGGCLFRTVRVGGAGPAAGGGG